MLQCCKDIICHFGDIQSWEQKLKAHNVLVSACWRVLKPTNHQNNNNKTKNKNKTQNIQTTTIKTQTKKPSQRKKKHWRWRQKQVVHEGSKKLEELMVRSTVLGLTGTFSDELCELESGPGWLTQDTKWAHYCPKTILVLLLPVCCQDKGTVHF